MLKNFLIVFGLLISTKVFAVCPICTFAVGAGIGFSQYLGIDDTITGLWIGGLIVSSICWTIDFLNKKNIRFYGRKIIVTILYYGGTIIPLYGKNIIGHALNKCCGYDKILLGIVVGSIAFFAGTLAYAYMKNKNAGKSYFPFQKVVMPVVPLIVLSIGFYFFTR